jgi:hypothetical protein
VSRAFRRIPGSTFGPLTPKTVFPINDGNHRCGSERVAASLTGLEDLQTMVIFILTAAGLALFAGVAPSLFSGSKEPRR